MCSYKCSMSTVTFLTNIISMYHSQQHLQLSTGDHITKHALMCCVRDVLDSFSDTLLWKTPSLLHFILPPCVLLIFIWGLDSIDVSIFSFCTTNDHLWWELHVFGAWWADTQTEYEIRLIDVTLCGSITFTSHQVKLLNLSCRNEDKAVRPFL